MYKIATALVSIFLLAGCHSMNNQHDALAVQCSVKSRTQDTVLIKFTNPGGVELTSDQMAQLQVQYQGLSNNQALTLTSRACVALPLGAARVKAKIAGDVPLTAEINLDGSAATDTIHTVELEAPGVLDLSLKCPRNGWLADETLSGVVDVKKSLGRLNGYKVDLAIYDSEGGKIKSLFSKGLQDENLGLPATFDIKSIPEGTYKVGLTVFDSYHDKKDAEAKSQCNLTVRRTCAKDEDFDPATVSCVPRLCDNAYRVGAKWTERLALERGEGRYECRLVNEKAEKSLLSHTCEAGYFKSSNSCLGARKVAGQCALLESDEVVCWGTSIGKENYPTRVDVNLQTTMKFPEKIKNFGAWCVETVADKVHCWSIAYGVDSNYWIKPESNTPKTWKQVRESNLAGSHVSCSEPDVTGACSFRVTQKDGMNVILPTPLVNSSQRCISDVEGNIWCTQYGLPAHQSLASSLQAGPFYRVEGLPNPARQVLSNNGNNCALLLDGHVMCWGSNESGSVGSNSSELVVGKPAHVVNSKGQRLKNIEQISYSMSSNSYATNFAMTKDGHVFAWGDNLDGNLANVTPGEDDEGNSLFSRFAVPVIVDVLSPIFPAKVNQ